MEVLTEDMHGRRVSLKTRTKSIPTSLKTDLSWSFQTSRSQRETTAQNWCANVRRCWPVLEKVVAYDMDNGCIWHPRKVMHD